MGYFKSFGGIGPFLSYQIAVDVGYFYPKVFDENLYTVAGPGCKMGLKRIFHNPKQLPSETLIQWLVDNQERYFESLKVDPKELFDDIDPKYESRLNLMAMENCLCEISKYIKVRRGEGKCRNAYNGLDDRPPRKKKRRKSLTPRIRKKSFTK